MSYEDQAALISDGAWRGKVDACTRQEAGRFVDDGRPEFNVLAAEVIHEPMGAAVFAVAAQVVGAPAMTAEATDGDILAAVQHVWPAVGRTYVTEEGTP